MEYIDREHRKSCVACAGNGNVPREFRCRPCNGSGRFTQERSGIEVDCLTCGGGGKFQHPRLVQECKSCEGKGEVKTFSNLNPVISEEIAERLRASVAL